MRARARECVRVREDFYYFTNFVYNYLKINQSGMSDKERNIRRVKQSLFRRNKACLEDRLRFIQRHDVHGDQGALVRRSHH